MAIINCTVQRSSWYSVYIEYTYKQDAATNISTISHALKLKQLTDGYDFNGAMDISYSVEGEVFSYSGNININDKGNKGYTITIKSGTTVVSHHSNGAKNVAFSCSGSCNAGGYGPGTIKLSTVNIPFDVIPRASTIDYAKDVTLGNACGITWTPKAAEFTYKLKFSIGSFAYTTPLIKPNTVLAYTYTEYKIPLDVAYQITNTESALMTVALYTYSDADGTTAIGSVSTETFTATVPDTIVPKITSLTVELDNSKNSVVAGWNVAVAGFTKVRVTATAEGAYGSTIKSFTISGGYNQTVNGSILDFVGSIINSSGSKSFDTICKDSRGRNSKQYLSSVVRFYSYATPLVSNFVVSRNAGDITKVTASANWSFASVNGNNTASGILYYRKSKDTVWSTYGEIQQNTDTVLDMAFDEMNSYNFTLIVTDALAQSDREDGFVSTMNVSYHYPPGGKSLAIGKTSEYDGLEVAWDARFTGQVYINGKTLEEFVKGNSGGILWSGSWWMTSAHTAKLSQLVSEQKNGIILVFSQFTDNAVNNSSFHHRVIHKDWVAAHPGHAECVQLTTSDLNLFATKYLYIHDDKIVGHDNNSKSGTGASGITYDNSGFILRYVIGF